LDCAIKVSTSIDPQRLATDKVSVILSTGLDRDTPPKLPTGLFRAACAR
jgi:hypothetical protein